MGARAARASTATRVPFLDLAALTARDRDRIDEAIGKVLDRGWYVLGENVAAFEEEWAAYVGARHCIGVGTGLDALVLSLRAAGIGPGDDVLVPSNTYIASWLAASACDARPVPVEPDTGRMVLSTQDFLSAMTPATRAVMPVHLYGEPAMTHDLRDALGDRDVFVIEDGAQSHGAALTGRRVGSWGTTVAWSFYPSKNLGALGDGGAITTDDDALAEHLRVLRNYGARTKYVNDIIGDNSRLDELQAAVLRAKLPLLAADNERRTSIAQQYLAGLADTPLGLPAPTPGHVWHIFAVLAPDRDALQKALADKGIDTLIHYPIPPHLQAAYVHLGLHRGQLPVSEHIHEHVLSLPIGPHLDDAQVARVIAAVCDVLA